MKLLLDMNLSPSWVPFLKQAGFDCTHWSDVGDARAPDAEIMQWARHNAHVLFTHDMDFGALLAATRARGPSVLLARVKDTMPDAIGADVVRVLHFRRESFERGALVTIDKAQSRVRILPLVPDEEPQKRARLTPCQLAWLAHELGHLQSKEAGRDLLSQQNTVFTKYAEELCAWTSARALLTKLGFEEWEVLHQLQTRSLESYRTGWALSIAEAEALEGVIAREFE